jgi:L-fuconolactonase
MNGTTQPREGRVALGGTARIDAHVHFLVYDPREHVWVTDELGCLKRSFLPDDLVPLLAGAGLDGCVAVEARQFPHENDWLLELARSHPTIKGIVGWVDLCAADVTTRLEGLKVHPQIKGFRHVVIDEPDDDFLLRDDFQRGIGALGPFGFTYDLLIYPGHLPAALQLVRKFPQQRFVLDHLGLPDIRGGQLAPWRAGLKALASRPNVFCKVSGLAYRAGWQRWRSEDFAPYLDAGLELFGPGRLMVGSNWPVCLVAGDYGAVLGIVLDRVRTLSPGEQAQILGGTCTHFYGLGPSAP